MFSFPYIHLEGCLFYGLTLQISLVMESPALR
jgi:hypothetical protein